MHLTTSIILVFQYDIDYYFFSYTLLILVEVVDTVKN